MCWSWNTEDIDLDEDDGKVWIPVTPKMLEEEAKGAQGSPRTPSVVKEMIVYLVGQGLAGDTQARTPVRQAAAMLKIMQPIVILANEESSEGSESSEASEAKEGEPPAAEQKTRPGSTTRKGMTRAKVGDPVERQGPKSQLVVTLTTPRPVLCDRWQRVGRDCFSWKKGPETLITCMACFKVKMSCKTGDDGA